jgi:hypothetical protein
MSTDMRQRLALLDLFTERLSEAARERGKREYMVPGLDGDDELGWVAYERAVMWHSVNAEVYSRGLPGVGLGEIIRVERSAAGHCDYVKKYALGCTFLVEDAIREAAAQALREEQVK